MNVDSITYVDLICDVDWKVPKGGYYSFPANVHLTIYFSPPLVWNETLLILIEGNIF